MPVLGGTKVPADKINLRLILVSGKTREYLFAPSESAGDIAQFVFDNWPEEWREEAVTKAEILRLIYQGRFLHGNVTLSALGLPTGLAVLRPPLLLHTLGESRHVNIQPAAAGVKLVKSDFHPKMTKIGVAL